MYLPVPETATKWRGLPVQFSQGDLNETYLHRIHNLLEASLAIHARWSVIRVDLRAPQGQDLPAGAITDFIESLKAQLEHEAKKKRRSGKRAYQPMLHYLWVREQAMAEHPHYHVALLINRDAHFTTGNYGLLHQEGADYSQSLAGRICKAWGSALGIEWQQALPGVHFPQTPVSELQLQGTDFGEQYLRVFYRLSYFAKHQSKVSGAAHRNLGMSQLTHLQARRVWPIP
ncbi:hypothetical protein DMO17_18775 [Aquipseudomonas alcaligenes]|uniref:YagK/YfjJ C-terminal domain-containing protein n=1 Tax=Aquipseudomonas alcaligenes TaxID=43263 RepID=A0A2V4L257_AQUAC|nr:inovirus Gp2 family protein [Pseudomonas alcaligenes]PYC20243.1 hypothetical protein DMO17_18775 [Pseudomonas alcaligenes]